MAPVGGLKRIKKFWNWIKNTTKKVKDWVVDKGLDMAVKLIKLFKAGKFDTVLAIVKTFVPQAAIAAEIVDKVKLIMKKVDEDKLKDILKKALKGDLSELRELTKVYNPKGSIDTYDRYFGNSIN